NYIIMGIFTTVLKININGDTLWSRGPYNYNGNFVAVKQVQNGGFIICGSIEQSFRVYPYLFRIDSNGSFLWSKTYTTNIFDGRFSDITISDDGNFVMCGNLSDSSYITDKLFIMKTDTSGNQIWLRRYDTLIYYTANSITKSPDSGFIIGGQYDGAFLSKFNSFGFMQWFKQYDIGSFVRPDCRSVITTNDGSYIYTGVFDSTGNYYTYMRIRKTDQNGNEIWRRAHGFSGNESGIEIRQTSDSGYIVIGLTEIPNINEEFYIVKTDKNGNAAPYIGIKPISEIVPKFYKLYPNYPNPFNSSTDIKFDIPLKSNVKMVIYDLLGKELNVIDDNLDAGTYNIKWIADDFASGIYFVRLSAAAKSNSYTKTIKLILIK
ncbi:MAG: T9SS type A sorting domain-containing protein, partial [Ignavibacteria bacterium]